MVVDLQQKKSGVENLGCVTMATKIFFALSAKGHSPPRGLAEEVGSRLRDVTERSNVEVIEEVTDQLPSSLLL